MAIKKEYSEKELDNLQKILDSYEQPDYYDWSAFCDNVVYWNLLGKGKHDFSEEAYDNQISLIKEEFYEVLEAIEEQDILKVKKELVDLAVVSCYGYYLLAKQNPVVNPFFNKVISLVKKCSVDIHVSPFDMFNWAVSELRKIGQYVNVANGILEANWAKIPTINEFLYAAVKYDWTFDVYDGDKEEYLKCPLEEAVASQIKYLEDNNKNRYTGVYYELVGDNKERIVFRDSENKVMKPYTFKKF